MIFVLKDKKVDQEHQRADRQDGEAGDKQTLLPIPIEGFVFLTYRGEGPSVVFSDVGAGFSGKGLSGPGASPAPAANPAVTMGARSEAFGIEGNDGPANLAALGIINQHVLFGFRQSKPPAFRLFQG
jgi:hypothetical protein